MNKLTLRILNIPSSTTAETLTKLLQCLTVNTDHATNPAKRARVDNIYTLSLAPWPPSTDSDRYQVATVTFRKIPADLVPCTLDPGWVNIELGDGETSFRVIADSYFRGFTPLNNPSHPSVDIIAVTGLGGHAFGSWRSRQGPEMWLRDFIPGDLEHAGYHARVLTYGYDTTLLNSLSSASVSDISKQFLELLKGTRLKQEERSRPIIFIGHSFGGLVIKKALREADYQNDATGNDILRSCHGILFFGVPNKGLGSGHLIGMVKGQPNSRLVEDLCSKSQFLDLLDKEFCRYFKSQATKIVCYYELKNTPTVKLDPETKCWQRSGTPMLMVPSESALHPPVNTGTALDADHQSMVRYGNSSEPNYQIVKLKIMELVVCAPHKRGSGVRYIGEATEQQKECLRSLVSENNDPSVRLPSRAKAHPGTCRWLLNDKAFKDWRSTDNKSKLLWISGYPGTGKTVVMHFLLNELKETSPTVCFFCDDKIAAQRTAISVLRSLVHQLLRWNTTFFKHIMHDFEQFKQAESKTWSFDTLWRIFRDIACDPAAESVCCLIDALDECQDEDKGVEYSRSDLLERVIELYSSNPECRARLIISSRPYKDLRSFLGAFPTIHIHEGTNGSDISNYINQRLDKSFKKGISDEMKHEVADFLNKEARGMFLWVALVIKDLSRDFTDASIRNRYKTLPRDLYGYYDNTLAKIPSDDHSRAKAMLMWIVYAPSPMTLDELNTALAISEATSDDSTHLSSIQDLEPYKSHNLRHELLERCGLLVEVEGDLGDSEPESREGPDVVVGGAATVRLIHQSVKDFFTQPDTMKKSTHHGIFHTPLEQAHSYLAQSCLMFATLEGFTDDAAAVKDYICMPREHWAIVYRSGLQVFTEYCSKHGMYHLKQSGTLLPITKELLLSCSTTNLLNFNVFLGLYPDKDVFDDRSDVSPLHAMCHFGVALGVSFLVENRVDLEERDNDGFTALLLAARAEEWGIVSYLIDHGADFTAEWEYGNMLHLTAKSGPIDLLRTLARNAVEAKLDSVDGKTPLELACSSDIARAMAIVESVVEKEEVLMVHLSRGTVRLDGAAAEATMLQAMLYLVQVCDNVNKRDRWGASLLHYAYTVEICEALVKKGANINAEDSTGNTPLHYARNAAIARFLVMNGADIHCRNSSGKTPLDTLRNFTKKDSLAEAAVWQGLRGTYLGWRDQNGDSILHSAVKRGNRCIVQSAVQLGANVDSRGNNGNTLLNLVVRAGNIEMARTLVDLGGDVNILSENGESLLHVAVKQDNRRMVEILISGGSDPCLKDSNGITPLDNALWVGNQKVISILQNGGKYEGFQLF